MRFKKAVHILYREENIMNENDLRELVAKNISKLKPGLTLLQKEQYIPPKPWNQEFY